MLRERKIGWERDEEKNLLSVSVKRKKEILERKSEIGKASKLPPFRLLFFLSPFILTFFVGTGGRISVTPRVTHDTTTDAYIAYIPD